MELFYATNLIDNNIILDKEESNHCINVLRYSIGDNINVVDGRGNMYQGVIVDVIKKECHVKIKKIINDFKKKKYYIHIGISAIKNHARLEWFIEKSIEIGVDEITILKCSRTQRKSVRSKRIDKIAKTAMKQTIKAKLPIINYMVKFNEFINNKSVTNKFICHLNNEINFTLFKHIKKFKNKKTCILIGPEGDFTQKEVSNAVNENYIEITLGTSRLRTETAGVVACNTINAIYENL